MEGRVLVLLMVFMVVTSGVLQCEGVVQCSQVTSNSARCIAYVTGLALQPSTACCAGIKVLDALASQNVQNRRDICGCLQNTAKTFNPNPAIVAKLPSLCGATHPFSLSQDCSKVP